MSSRADSVPRRSASSAGHTELFQVGESNRTFREETFAIQTSCWKRTPTPFSFPASLRNARHQQVSRRVRSDRGRQPVRHSKGPDRVCLPAVEQSVHFHEQMKRRSQRKSRTGEKASRDRSTPKEPRFPNRRQKF